MTIGERILATAKQKRLSQGVLAKMLGIAQASVSAWKKGSVPSSDKIVPLAEILEVSVEYILTGKDVPIQIVKSDKREIGRLEGKIEEQKERIKFLEEQIRELIAKLSPVVDNRQNRQ